MDGACVLCAGCRSTEDKTRCAALGLLAAAVEGVGGNHRNALAVQAEALRTAERLAKDRDSTAVRWVQQSSRGGGLDLGALSTLPFLPCNAPRRVHVAVRHGNRNCPHACRVGAAGVVRALARSGGAHLWTSSMAGFEEAKATCLAGIDDPSSHAARTAWAQALGEIVVASTSDAGVAP